jgi:formate dehydrogenase assembly factor FdhD
MMDKTEKAPIIRIFERGKKDDLEYLVAGVLASEGLIESKDEIKKMAVDDEAGVVRVETNLSGDKELMFIAMSGGL